MENILNRNCLFTFDIEEWFQVENLKGAIHREDWKSKKSTVEKNTEKILAILDRHYIKGTFFILGWIAQENKELIKEIADRNHEIACHGFSHDIAYQLDQEKLRSDILQSKTLLEEICGQTVTGYRAPSFSISDKVLSILKSLDFEYDSSYNPFKWNNRYGHIDTPLKKITDGCYQTEHGIFEIPLSTLSHLNLNFPVGGGAYFRIIPFFIFKNLVKTLLKKKNFYNFYLHPWEFEFDQERIKNIKWQYKFRHYYGLEKTEVKLEKLINFLKESECEFLTVSNYVNQIKKHYAQ
jgi:polysaccharide deacetylase family protein (PEP-CTERM system associated)